MKIPSKIALRTTGHGVISGIVRDCGFLPIVLLLVLFAACDQEAGGDVEGILVKDVAAFEKATQNLQPGDRIVLANGVWNDAELIFTGKGTAEAPIELTVETLGGVTLEGQSNLRMAGEHLIVRGLVFKNGFTPTTEVISLRRGKNDLCNDCRVTECVIDNYNNPERNESDYWVGIYGKRNRFDHNHLTGKRNRGVTLAVRLNTEESRENNHRIDHNYFGPRPIFGSNGGETLRIGTSHYSMSNSNTVVEQNYFDRCDGEHEIISNKSGQNIFRGNTFYECQGTLTMRHGNETLVENNYFFGNGRPNTGGIRIINETQTVRNNYHEGLTGYRFRGALVIMNGVPNSPLNRYFQVIDSKADHNTYINCDHIQLGAGSDEERSAVPIRTTMNNNLFYHDSRKEIFTVYDDMSGIAMEGNVLNEGLNGVKGREGFAQQKIELKRDEFGRMLPTDANITAGVRDLPPPVKAEETGVSWYARAEEGIVFNQGATRTVQPGENTLFDAVAASESGDILELAPGTYSTTKAIAVKHPLTVRGTGAGKPVLVFEKNVLFQLENGGALTLTNLSIDGAECPDYAGNAVVRTSKYSMNRNYKLLVENCDFTDLDVNHSFNVLRAAASTFADSVLLRNSTFKNISGTVLALDAEVEDGGVYSAENVIIDNCSFEDVGGAALALRRGGRDESTFGPMLDLQNSSFKNVGTDRRNKADASVALHGVQEIRLSNNRFEASDPLRMHLVVGEPVTQISGTTLTNTETVVTHDGSYPNLKLNFD